MSSIDDLSLPDFAALRVEWERHQRKPYVRMWRVLRDIPWYFRALVCRARGHRWEESEYWSDWGKESHATCRRCGKVER